MATKKTTRRTKKAVVTEEPVIESSTSTKSRSFAKSKLKYLFIIVPIILLIGLLYIFRGLFIAATVNNQPISRMAFIQELEKQGGQQTLDSMVTETLIMQEAQKNNITVSDEELDQEVKKLEDNLKQQQQDLNALLQARGMSRDDLKDQLKTQKLIEKILGNKIQVSDKEVSDYISQNQEALGEQASSKEMETQIREQLKQQKLGNAFQEWLTQARNNANIHYFVNF